MKRTTMTKVMKMKMMSEVKSNSSNACDDLCCGSWPCMFKNGCTLHFAM